MNLRTCFLLFIIAMTPGLTYAQSDDLIASDFDGSGRVDFSDFLEFAGAFGKIAGQEGFDTKFDLDGSSSIDFGDFLIFASNFGKSTTQETATYLYIADFFSDRVEVIDIASNLTIPSRAFSVSFPRGLAFGSQTGEALPFLVDSRSSSTKPKREPSFPKTPAWSKSSTSLTGSPLAKSL